MIPYVHDQMPFTTDLKNDLFSYKNLCYLFNAWRPLKGHIYLNKPAAFSSMFV